MASALYSKHLNFKVHAIYAILIGVKERGGECVGERRRRGQESSLSAPRKIKQQVSMPLPYHWWWWRSQMLASADIDAAAAPATVAYDDDEGDAAAFVVCLY